MNKKTIRDVDVRGKRVLVRADFNVPIDQHGRVLDDTRITATLPTIRYLLDHGASVILMSHLGRPQGKPSPSLSLRPVSRRLGELLGAEVPLAPESVGPEVERLAAGLRPGQLLLLENLRFHAEEERNDPGFAAQLGRLGDLYVDDAFGTAHRAHASTEGVAHVLPAVAGLLMEREIDYLSRVLEAPERPFVAIIGGAKISTKTAVLSQLLPRVTALAVGGAMACTFLKAGGAEVGDSLVEDDMLDAARDIAAQASASGVRLLIPPDAVIADRFAADAAHRVVPSRQIPAGWRMMDVGPRTVEEIAALVRDAKTVLWNGPMGVFELAPFAGGTVAVARALADCGGTTIAGGGETVAAIDEAGVADKLSHVSTGGGATLEFLEGRTLPGVAALQDR